VTSPYMMATTGSLSNGDGNDNDNGKEATSLDSKTTTFTHFLAVVERLRLETQTCESEESNRC